MKRILLTLSIFGATGFAPSLFAAGTRGGGTICELEFKTHLILALNWVDSQDQWSIGHGLMTPAEIKKVQAIVLEKDADWKYLLPKEVSVKCTTDELKVGGKTKTAITELLEDGTFYTQVNLITWEANADNNTVRTGIALHEVLVMAQIEATDDYHISQSLIDFGRLPIRSLACTTTNRVWFEHFTVSLAAAPDQSGLYVGKLIYDHRDDLHHYPDMPHDHLEFTFSYQMICTFSRNDPRIFQCVERSNGRDTVVVESVLATVGQKLTVKWNQLISVIPLKDFIATLAAHNFLFTDTTLGDPKDFTYVFPEDNSGDIQSRINKAMSSKCTTEVVSGDSRP